MYVHIFHICPKLVGYYIHTCTFHFPWKKLWAIGASFPSIMSPHGPLIRSMVLYLDFSRLFLISIAHRASLSSHVLVYVILANHNRRCKDYKFFCCKAFKHLWDILNIINTLFHSREGNNCWNLFSTLFLRITFLLALSKIKRRNFANNTWRYIAYFF